MPSDEAALSTVSTLQSEILEAVVTLLQQEINKLNDISGVQSVNWRQVEQLAAEQLAQGAQHFQVAAYWGVAKVCNQGFGAIAEGALCLTTLVEQHWEQAAPSLKRMRGRTNAMAWWLERVLLWIKQYSGPPLAGPLHEQAIAAVNAFDRALNQRCPAVAPVLYPLINALQQLPVEKMLEAPLPTEVKSSTQAQYGAQNADQQALMPSKAADPSFSMTDGLLTGPLLASDQLQQLINQATAKAHAGEISAAIKLLHQAAPRFMPADQLRIECHLIQFLFQADQTTLCLMRLQQALDKVKQHGLEQWEPPLAALVLQQAYLLFNATGSRETAQEVLLRLSLIDPAKAVESLST